MHLVLAPLRTPRDGDERCEAGVQLLTHFVDGSLVRQQSLKLLRGSRLRLVQSSLQIGEMSHRLLKVPAAADNRDGNDGDVVLQRLPDLEKGRRVIEQLSGKKNDNQPALVNDGAGATAASDGACAAKLDRKLRPQDLLASTDGTYISICVHSHALDHRN